MLDESSDAVNIYNGARTIQGNRPPDLRIEANGSRRLNHAIVSDSDVIYLPEPHDGTWLKHAQAFSLGMARGTR
ncbi:MAG: hypothetical protein ACYTHJ_10635 [Planctomycetota bacterium]